MNGRNVKEKCLMALPGALPFCVLSFWLSLRKKAMGRLFKFFHFKLEEIEGSFILGWATKD